METNKERKLSSSSENLDSENKRRKLNDNSDNTETNKDNEDPPEPCSSSIEDGNSKVTENNEESNDLNETFDEEYFPEAVEIKILNETDWSSDESIPYWLSFVDTYPYRLEALTEKEYKDINIDFINAGFEIIKADKINCPFLKRSFELKKIGKGMSPKEERWFHVTKFQNIDSICRNNFNWRFNGQRIKNDGRGNRHGKGVSFSPYVQFVDFFSFIPEDFYIFISSVLYTDSHTGDFDVVLPDDGYDATHAPKENVYNKYEDNEFLPKYLVNYKRKKNQLN